MRALRVVALVAVAAAALWAVVSSCRERPSSAGLGAAEADALTGDSGRGEESGETERRRVHVGDRSAGGEEGVTDSGSGHVELRIEALAPDGEPAADGRVSVFVPVDAPPGLEMPGPLHGRLADVELRGGRAAIVVETASRAGRALRVVVASPSGAPWVSAPLDVPDEGVVEVVAELEPGREIRGRVLGFDGSTPVAGAIVRVMRNGSILGGRVTVPSPDVRADEEGRFHVTGLDAGRVSLQVDPPPELRTLGNGVRLGADAGDVDVRVYLKRTVYVRFLPVDVTTGEAPRTALLELVELDGGEERTIHTRGRLNLDPALSAGPPVAIPPGAGVRIGDREPRTFRVRLQGYADSPAIVVDPTEGDVQRTVRVDLHPDPGEIAVVRVRVKAEEGGALPKRVWLLRHAPGGGGWTGASWKPGEGPFDVRLEAGRHDLEVRAWLMAGVTDAPWVAVPLPVDLGRGATRDVDVVLHEGGFLRVRGSEETLRNPTRVTCEGEAVPVEFRRGRDDAGLHATSSPLLPGRYDVEWTENGATRRLPVAVVAREVTEIEMPSADR